MSSVPVQATSAAEQLDVTHGLGQPFRAVNRALVLYWLFCLAVGVLLLRDQMLAWKIPAAWLSAPIFLFYAVAITLFNEWAYIRVARSDGRPLSWPATIIFTLINGTLEAFAFMAFYQLLYGGLRLLLGPDWEVLNFIAGFIGFVVYSGLAHALFWARALPRHFTAEPGLQRLRKALGPIQALIVLGWCLYFWATGDLWTIVGLHLIIDVVLMVRVRPPVLMAFRPTPAEASPVQV